MLYVTKLPRKSLKRGKFSAKVDFFAKKMLKNGLWSTNKVIFSGNFTVFFKNYCWFGKIFRKSLLIRQKSQKKRLSAFGEMQLRLGFFLCGRIACCSDENPPFRDIPVDLRMDFFVFLGGILIFSVL